jgi:uncharacterized membrane protein
LKAISIIKEKNVGKNDKIFRIIVGLIIVVLAVLFKSIWGLLAALPIITAIYSFCPLYKFLNISTTKRK